MDAKGLTAFVVTVHVPALVLSGAVGLLAALVARAIAGRAPVKSTRGARGLLWGVAVAVVVYAVVCRAVGVSPVGIEAIALVD